MVPAVDQAFVAGSYTSALDRLLRLSACPPKTSTLPLASRVALWPYRAVAMEAAADQPAAAGSPQSTLTVHGPPSESLNEPRLKDWEIPATAVWLPGDVIVGAPTVMATVFRSLDGADHVP